MCTVQTQTADHCLYRNPKAEDGEPFDAESFDYILLDAPCSALGIRPRLTQHTSLKELQRTARYQRDFMDTAVRLLKPGGSLVFSTCTISPMENEGNVRYMLDAHAEMRLAGQEPRIGGHGLVGEGLLTEAEAGMVQRFTPSTVGDVQTPGFFIAKFVKSGEQHRG